MYIYIYTYIYMHIYMCAYVCDYKNIPASQRSPVPKTTSPTQLQGLGMGKLAANPVFHPLSSRRLSGSRLFDAFYV